MIALSALLVSQHASSVAAIRGSSTCSFGRGVLIPCSHSRVRLWCRPPSFYRFPSTSTRPDVCRSLAPANPRCFERYAKLTALLRVAVVAQRPTVQDPGHRLRSHSLPAVLVAARQSGIHSCHGIRIIRCCELAGLPLLPAQALPAGVAKPSVLATTLNVSRHASHS